jgi:hypothetical protein
MTKTGLEFGILVIVIWDFYFSYAPWTAWELDIAYRFWLS